MHRQSPICNCVSFENNTLVAWQAHNVQALALAASLKILHTYQLAGAQGEAALSLAKPLLIASESLLSLRRSAIRGRSLAKCSEVATTISGRRNVEASMRKQL